MKVNPSSRLLELGCGDGDLTYSLRELGINAIGADFSFRNGPYLDKLSDAKALVTIPADPYRLPFDDHSIDVIVSTQVFEHVMDFPTTLKELARVQHPEGIGIHIFPSRFRPLEIHTAIPLGGVLNYRAWITLWSIFCRKLPSARGLPLLQRSARHQTYLSSNVNYISHRKLIDFAKIHFQSAKFNAWAFHQYSPRERVRELIRWLPFRSQLTGTFFEQVLLLSQPN